MLLLQTTKLEKQFGARVILDNEPLYIYKDQRIGLVGKNGAGKTTLLHVLAGYGVADFGQVTRYEKMAYIPQLHELSAPLSAREAKQWQVPAHVHKSGGEQTRAKIAQALEANAALILADEPTSHLDMEGMKQLEQVFTSFSGGILLTSHDKTFLNNVCTSIWEIEDGKVKAYEGNYDAYLVQKQKEMDKAHKAYQSYQLEKDRLLQAAKQAQRRSDQIKKAPSRMGNSEARLHKRSSGVQKAKINRAAEAMVTRANQLEKKEKPKEETKIQFDLSRFPVVHSKQMIQFEAFQVWIEGRLLKEVNGVVPAGSRVAIIGKNGSGKSTLLQQIESRQMTIAKPAKIGYFSQHQHDILDEETILENVGKNSPYSETFIRTVLSRLAFQREDVFKKGIDLSGGERVRTALAKVFLSNVNLWLLDEPTNYLDLTTKDSLKEVMNKFPGTILFVTHDRTLIRDVATHQLSFDDERAQIKAVNQVEEELKKPDESLLTIEFKLSELLSRLSTVTDETERNKLDQQFQELLKTKRTLKNQ
ncbi:ribosomal protection-like ABC-F family protein [Shouchella miscanthi]|uniref:ribosomal protection-like ABC-F family protein n=1 Tax=Shouchella miscanthi TaxID=2598861 RepID=UPI0011A458B9|nr:ABC-F family ATP-binding cassette domain-containing protein [Shouchella miscanthi]